MSIFLTRPVINTEEERNAKADILELINFERFCRDNAQWDEMRYKKREEITVFSRFLMNAGNQSVKVFVFYFLKAIL